MLPSLPISVSFLAVVFMTSCVIASQQPLARPSALPAGSNRVVFIRHAEKGFSPDQLEKNVRVNNAPTTGEGIEPVKRSDPDDPSTRSFPGSILRDPQTPGGPPRRGGPPGRGRPPGRGGPPGRGPPPDGKFPNGLSEKGKERAQYIRTLFGNESDFDFGLIFAAPWNASLKETERTYATVAPLAADLGLEVNIKCANAEPSCIVNEIQEFAKVSDKDILISWKHFYLNIIATELGASNARKTYPDERNDVIWIMEGDRIVEKRSMHCPKLDDGRVDEGDPDLKVEDPRFTLAQLKDLVVWYSGLLWRSVGW